MKILIVEDDPSVSSALVRGLTQSGLDVHAVNSAENAIRQLVQDQPDLVVLDIGLPGRDGYHVLSTLRDRGDQTPVLILTAQDAVDDRVRGLEAGADDYLVKPFAFPELLARIRARLRIREDKKGQTLCVEDLEVDPVNRRVSRNGDIIGLTLREFDLLRCLVENTGQPVSREMLARDVWQVTSRATPLDNVIDVHISHLRAKIDTPERQPLIHTIRGVGFILKGTP